MEFKQVRFKPGDKVIAVNSYYAEGGITGYFRLDEAIVDSIIIYKTTVEYWLKTMDLKTYGDTVDSNFVVNNKDEGFKVMLKYWKDNPDDDSE